MTEQEYKHIRNLAWKILIDTGANSLPIQLDLLSKHFNIELSSDSYFDRAVELSSNILAIFGYQRDFANVLAVRILAPMIVLKEINISSGSEIAKRTGLPIQIANNRYERLQVLIKRNAFCTSRLERLVLKQFETWIAANR